MNALATVLRDQHIDKLRQAEARCLKLRALIDGLRVPGAEGFAFSMRARIDANYQIWADQKRRDLNILLARAYVEREQCLMRARASFGRSEALRQIVDKQKEDARLQKLRRRT